jgi:hypothetical protein
MFGYQVTAVDVSIKAVIYIESRNKPLCVERRP